VNFLKISQLTTESVEQAARLLNAYRVAFHQPADLSLARWFVKERLKQDESVVFLAWLGEEAVGFVQLYPIFSTISLKRAYILNDLYVAKEARKHGAATQLIEACYTYAKAHNARFVALETGTENDNAQKLYEKMGFIEETDVMHLIKYFDEHESPSPNS